jgi:uncharacterized protein (TIGR02421 family)
MDPFSSFTDLDARISAIGRSFRVLSHLAWPESCKDVFLTGWRAGVPALPEPELSPIDTSGQVAEIEDLMRRCDRQHPIGDYLWKTAWSYATASRMLASIGTPEFTEHSVALYGRPDVVYERQGLSVLDAADPIMDVTSELVGGGVIRSAEATIPAEEFGTRLKAALDAFFTDDDVAVVIDPGMAAKAAAGSRRVKLRAGALFSEADFHQLLNHEALIHSLTLLNGQRQPLRALGLGSPRTTRTQEGLAVFSELATGSIDLPRLRRVALRAQAVSKALAGADFIEVFQHFLAEGQSEEEAYHSAQRIFRGGDVRGGVAFTKDGAYLEGLILVQTFLRKAISDGREELIPHLFAGRMTLGDAVLLEDLFGSGDLVEPRYVPPWATGLSQLAASLAYSLFSARIKLDVVEIARFVELDDR